MSKGNVLSANVYPVLRIGDMERGDRGYTVPWAYNPATNNLDESYPWRSEPCGTVTMEIACVKKGKYRVRQERE